MNGGKRFLVTRMFCFTLALALALVLPVNARDIPDETDIDQSGALTRLYAKVEAAQSLAISETKAMFSLMGFLEENNLTAGAIPEDLPQKTMEALEKLCDSRYYAIGFYYYDITTGFSIGYEADRTFRGASSIKLPYIAYVLDLIDNGKVKLEDKITLRQSDIKSGTSTIRDEKIPAGTDFTVRELIELLIVDSDNSAFSMLGNKYSVWSFASWANNKYGTRFYTARDKNGAGVNSMDAKSTAVILKMLYEKAEKGVENYVWLLEIMKKANKNTFVKYGLADNSNGIWYEKDRRNDIEVSHKYGMDVYASNDAALVHFEGRPYILVILTDWIGYNSDNAWWMEGDMRTVSYYIYQLHKYLVSLSNA